MCTCVQVWSQRLSLKRRKIYINLFRPRLAAFIFLSILAIYQKIKIMFINALLKYFYVLVHVSELSQVCCIYAPSNTTSSIFSPVKFGEDYKLSSFSLYSSLQTPLTFSLFGPSIVSRTLSLNILNPRSSLTVNEQVLHLHETRVLYTFYI